MKVCDTHPYYYKNGARSMVALQPKCSNKMKMASSKYFIWTRRSKCCFYLFLKEVRNYLEKGLDTARLAGAVTQIGDLYDITSN